MVRKIQAKLVLELRAQGLSARAIAAAHGISRNSIVWDVCLVAGFLRSGVLCRYLVHNRCHDLWHTRCHHLEHSFEG